MYEKYFVPFPVIETEHLYLRQVRRRDASDMYEFCRRAETSRYALWNPHESPDDTRDFIAYQLSLKRKHRCFFFVMEEKQSGKVVGTCSYVSMDDKYKIAEIGYTVSSDRWNKGYATEAAWGLCEYAFDVIGVQRISARVLPDNKASERVLEKLKFTPEGREKKGYYFDGKVSDVDVFSLTDDEYFAIKESGS